MSAVSYSLEQYVADLQKIAAETADEDEILQRVGPLAQRFVADRSWLEPKHYETDAEQGFGVHLLHEEPDLVYKVMRAIIRTVHGILRRMNAQYVEMQNYITRQHGRY